MNRIAKSRLLKESIEDDKIWQRNTGVTGDFHCPSCNQLKPRVGSYHEEETNITLCSECFYQWGILKIEGKSNSFKDMVPNKTFAT